MLSRSVLESMPQVFSRFDYGRGGILWIHAPTGAAAGAVAWCPDGRPRSVVRFHHSGQQTHAGAWSGSVRVRGCVYRGTVAVKGGPDTESASLRFYPGPRIPPGWPNVRAPSESCAPWRVDPGRGFEVPPEWREPFRSGEDLIAARSPRYDSAFRIVGRVPFGPVEGLIEVRFVSGRPVECDGTRVWIETETAISEGIPAPQTDS